MAAKFTIVGTIEPAGKPKSDTNEMRLARIPYSDIERFLLIKRLNKKFNTFPKIEPMKITELPLIRGWLINVNTLSFIA